MNRNKNVMKNASLLIIGDFNSFVGYDSEKQPYSHINVMNDLKKAGIQSLYHKYYEEREGNESRYTHYNQKKESRRYHVDYILGSEWFSSSIKCLAVGEFEKWIKYSDHMPIYVEFKNNF